MNVKLGATVATVVVPRTIVALIPLPAVIGMDNLVRPAGTVVVCVVPVVSVTVAEEVASTTTQTVSLSYNSAYQHPVSVHLMVIAGLPSGSW